MLFPMASLLQPYGDIPQLPIPTIQAITRTPNRDPNLRDVSQPLWLGVQFQLLVALLTVVLVMRSVSANNRNRNDPTAFAE